MFAKTVDKSERTFYTYHCQQKFKRLVHHTNGVATPLNGQAFIHTHKFIKDMNLNEQKCSLALLHIIYINVK